MISASLSLCILLYASLMTSDASLGCQHAQEEIICLVSHEIHHCGVERIVLMADEGNSVTGLISEFLVKSSTEFTFYDNIILSNQLELTTIVGSHLDNQLKRPTTFLLATAHFRDVLKAAESYFVEDGRSRGSIAPHSSKWVVLVSSKIQMDSLAEQQRNSTFDNVAAIHLQTDNTIFEMFTFMWRDNRVRTVDIVAKENLYGNSDKCFLFPNVRHGLNGRHLDMITKVHWGFVVDIRNNTETGNLEYYGYLLDVMDALALAMNFTYTAYPLPTDLQYSWDEYAEVTFRGDFDLGLTTWSYSWSSVYNMSFTFPVIVDSYTGIYRRHLPAYEFNSFFIICPFSPMTYVCLIASCAYTTSIYVLIVGVIYPQENEERFRSLVCLSKKDKKKNQTAKEAAIVTVIKDLMARTARTSWALMASILNQGYLPRPKQMSARVLLFLWSLAIVMFYAIYTGSLTAEMVARPVAEPFKSFREMVNKGSYRWGTIENSAIHYLMKDIKGGIIEVLSKDAENIPDAHLGDVYDTLTYMLEDLEYDYVFIHFHSLLNQILAVSKYPGHYKLIPESLMTANQGFVAPLNSELCELFSVYIKKMQHSGLIWKIYSGYASGNGTTAEEIDANASDSTCISFENMKWPFSIVLIVLIISMPVLAMEKLFDLVCRLRVKYSDVHGEETKHVTYPLQ